MKSLNERKASRKDRNEQGEQQTKEGAETVYAKPGEFHAMLKASAEVDIAVATDDFQRAKAERLHGAIHAPGKTDKQEKSADLNATTASKSPEAQQAAQQQAQTGAGGNVAGNGGGAGWTTGSGAMDGNAGATAGAKGKAAKSA